jgi:hypothetical protein
MNFTPYAVDHQSVTRFMSRNIEFVVLLRYLKEKTFGEAVIWPNKDTGCVHFYFARTPLSREYVHKIVLPWIQCWAATCSHYSSVQFGYRGTDVMEIIIQLRNKERI